MARVWMLLFLFALPAGCRSEAVGKYAICTPERIDVLNDAGDAVVSPGSELPGTAVEMKVTIFHIENVTPDGVTIRDIGIARAGDFVVRKADPASTRGAAQFRIKEIRQSQDGRFQAQVEKYELLASFVKCLS